MTVREFSRSEGKLVFQPKVRAQGTFFGAYPFWMHLHVYDAVDATTFTYDHNAVLTVPLRRVIYAKSKTDAKAVGDVEMRACANMHAKVFLCYSGKRLEGVFASSWNLVRPTWLEVVTAIPRKNWKVAAKWFDEIWVQSEATNKRVEVRRRPVQFHSEECDWVDEF